MEKRGDVARGCFESKSLGEKWEFRVMMVLTDWVARKWISSRRHDTHLFLEMLCILFPFGDYKWWVFVDDSFGSIIGISSCNGCGVVLHESSPFWPPSFIFSVSQFSHSVVSDSLWPHGLQHARPPCPSPTLGVYSSSSIESVMPSNHLLLCRSLLLPPSIFPSIRVSSNKSVLHIRWLKY